MSADNASGVFLQLLVARNSCTISSPCCDPSIDGPLPEPPSPSTCTTHVRLNMGILAKDPGKFAPPPEDEQALTHQIDWTPEEEINAKWK